MAPSTTLLRTWLLEEVLRYVQLSPLDVYHFGRGRKKEKHDRIVKILKFFTYTDPITSNISDNSNSILAEFTPSCVLKYESEERQSITTQTLNRNFVIRDSTLIFRGNDYIKKVFGLNFEKKELGQYLERRKKLLHKKDQGENINYGNEYISDGEESDIKETTLYKIPDELHIPLTRPKISRLNQNQIPSLEFRGREFQFAILQINEIEILERHNSVPYADMPFIYSTPQYVNQWQSFCFDSLPPNDNCFYGND